MTHTFGVRNDNPAFHEYFELFYKEVFFPYLKKHNISTVIQTGDMFDRRKYVNFLTLYKTRKYFFSEFTKIHEPLSLITYLGNHDSFFRNTLEVNSPSLLLPDNLGHIDIVDKPVNKVIGGLSIDFIPWICDDNYSHIRDFIEKSTSKFCFGHFELEGFEMDAGNFCKEGLDKSFQTLLGKYEKVFSGHFHHRSTDSHIYYVGAPYQMTWADYGDKRGFHTFDTESHEIKFIENPFKMFHKLSYDDRNDDFNYDSVLQIDFAALKNRTVKVVVSAKEDFQLFDQYMDKLYAAEPLDVSIVEDFTDYSVVTENESIDQTDSTTDILYKHIDSINMSLDKNKMKNVLTEVYNQAIENL